MIAAREPRWWSSALTLTERAALRPHGHEPSAPVAALPDTLAAHRLERWRRQPPFDKPDILARRLRFNRLTEGQFETLLATSPDRLVGADAPTWVHDVERAETLASQIARHSPRLANDGGLGPVRAFVEPFVTAGMARLYGEARAIAATNSDAAFEPAHATQLFEARLWAQLVGRAVKVVILELNVARVRGALVGNTAEERCTYFANQLRSGPVREAILGEYPVLARSLVTATNYWAETAAEFLSHVAADTDRLRAVFARDGELGALVALTANGGDPHRRGRSVMVAEFSSGTRIVYKPRRLDVDRHFEELVEWVNARGQTPTLRAVHSITVGDHGWAEFIANDACDSRDAVGRFYERFGACLAILHALNATDFHYENIIACGEHPMLIDLEALFHPMLESVRAADEPEWLGWEALRRSVLRTGALPFRAYDNEQSRGLDLSAMGGSGGQETPNRFPVLVAAGTDEMRFERDFVRLPPSMNRPALGADPVDPLAFADRVLAGFTATYRLLLIHRDELLATGGPVHRFADDPIRVVLRPTRQYALLLSESHHPDVMRDALERDRLFDRLWVAIPGRPELEQVVHLEHDDLTAGDVPLFVSRPSSCELFTTHGESLPGFFRCSGLESSLDRIRSMSDEDLVRQRWIIEASLVALVPGLHGEASPVPARAAGPVSRGVPASREETLAAASRVARRLVRLALRQGDRASWLGLTLVRERDWVIQPVGTDLYGGSMGIALFLAYFDAIVGDDTAKEVAQSVVAQVARRAREAVDALGSDRTVPPGALGSFGALGGTIYAFAHIGTLWNDPDLFRVAERLAAGLRNHVAADRTLDVIGGVAGFIMAAAALDGACRSEVARAAVQHAADVLVSRAEPRDDGLAWRTHLAASQPLLGLSHGASGMALALVTAGRLLACALYVDAAFDAIRYERTGFDPSRMNWPDYRLLDGRASGDIPPVMWAWCHGAPGIGLARLVALGIRHDRTALEDLCVALESTARFGFDSNDSLCHGDLGNLDLLVSARARGHDGPWTQAITTQSARLVGRLAREEWRCGIPAGVETPGLMTGLAGIGYGLLRLADPSSVPSLLCLEPPRATRGGKGVS